MIASGVARLVSNLIILYYGMTLCDSTRLIIAHHYVTIIIIGLGRVGLEANLQTQLFSLYHLISFTVSLESTEHGINNSDYFDWQD